MQVEGCARRPRESRDGGTDGSVYHKHANLPGIHKDRVRHRNIGVRFRTDTIRTATLSRHPEHTHLGCNAGDDPVGSFSALHQ